MRSTVPPSVRVSRTACSSAINASSAPPISSALVAQMSRQMSAGLDGLADGVGDDLRLVAVDAAVREWRSEQLAQVQGEARERGRKQRIALAMNGVGVVAVRAQDQDGYGPGVRVHQPELRHAVAGVEVSLDPPVVVGGGRRQDFDDEVRRAA